MKRTKKQRVEELNRIIKDVPNYQFGLMPRGYSPYSLNHDGNLYSGGYYKEVRAMALRMKYAVCEKRKIDFDIIFGCNNNNNCFV